MRASDLKGYGPVGSNGPKYSAAPPPPAEQASGEMTEARELLAAELDAIRFPAMAAEVRDPEGYNSCGAAMVRAVARVIAALTTKGEGRDRESDRARFSDAAFNEWLDTGISDCGHTVWDAVGDTQAAWAGWEARQFAGDAVLLAECCGREECGGECGNDWRGMSMYRKPPTDDKSAGKVDWRGLYRFSAAMRYMDNRRELTLADAERMAESDCEYAERDAALTAALAPQQPEKGETP